MKWKNVINSMRIKQLSKNIIAIKINFKIKCYSNNYV